MIEKRYDPTVILVIYNVNIENTHKGEKLGISLKKQLEIVAKVTTD